MTRHAYGTVTPDRLALASDAAQLRADGFTWPEIGDVLDISRSYAQQLVSDPDGTRTRARKDGYRGTCLTCGGPTTGSNGRAAAPTECSACADKRRHDDRYWTRPRIVAAIQRFNREHGRPPTSKEWLLGEHGRDGDGYPSVSLSQREFGSWNAAVEAAGFAPLENGGLYERTAESRERSRRAQAKRRGHARDYGPAVSTTVQLAADQIQALDSMNDVPRAEHVRRAIDLYLASKPRT